MNPVFFKVHGWVDDRIQTWLSAHGYQSIGLASECQGKTACYTWLSDPAYRVDVAEDASFDARPWLPWEGVAPGPARNPMGLHRHAIPVGAVPKLSVKARARIYSTRRMGGF